MRSFRRCVQNGLIGAAVTATLGWSALAAADSGTDIQNQYVERQDILPCLGGQQPFTKADADSVNHYGFVVVSTTGFDSVGDVPVIEPEDVRADVPGQIVLDTKQLNSLLSIFGCDILQKGRQYEEKVEYDMALLGVKKEEIQLYELSLAKVGGLWWNPRPTPGDQAYGKSFDQRFRTQRVELPSPPPVEPPPPPPPPQPEPPQILDIVVETELREIPPPPQPLPQEVPHTIHKQE